MSHSLQTRGSSLSFGHTSRHGRVARTGRACVTSVQKLVGTAIFERLGVVRADFTGTLLGKAKPFLDNRWELLISEGIVALTVM